MINVIEVTWVEPIPSDSSVTQKVSAFFTDKEREDAANFYDHLAKNKIIARWIEGTKQTNPPYRVMYYGNSLFAERYQSELPAYKHGELVSGKEFTRKAS